MTFRTMLSNITGRFIRALVEPAIKPYSKLKFLESIGFIRQKFDGRQFEWSCRLAVRSFLVQLSLVAALFKQPLCLFFGKNDAVQLYIGALWNNQAEKIRFCMGMLVRILIILSKST